MAIPYRTAKANNSCNLRFWAQLPNLVPANVSGYTVYVCWQILILAKLAINFVQFSLKFVPTNLIIVALTQVLVTTIILGYCRYCKVLKVRNLIGQLEVPFHITLLGMLQPRTSE